MSVKTILFCGHHSPYGMAHLQPLINSRLEISHVILANNERWDEFYESLQGKQYYSPVNDSKNYLFNIKKLIKDIFPEIFSNRRKNKKHKEYNRQTKIVIDFLNRQKISFIEVFDANDLSFINTISQIRPDLIISAAYPQIFSKDLISVAFRGSVNFHPSLLPKYRGAHPHFWVIAKGEKYGGITAHFMTENLDDGEIIAQIEFPIENYNYSELYNVIIKKTPELVQLVSNFFYFDHKKAIPQDLSQVSHFRNNREIHHKILWNIHSGEDIKNLVRTQRAYCFLGREKVAFWEIELRESNRNLTNNIQVENGTIVDFLQTNIVVKCQHGCIYLKKVEINNQLMSAQDWAKKANLKIGEKFM